MAEQKVSIIYELIDKASNGINSIKKNISDFSGTALKAASVGFAALTAAVGFSIKEAIESEKAISNLTESMKLAGVTNQKAIDDQIEYATALQKTTKYTDEQIMAAQAQLATFGLLGEDLKKATKAAIEFSAGTGTDLQSSAMLMAKAFQGSTGMLGRYGIVLDEGLSKTEKFDAATKKITELFAGKASTEIKSISGQFGIFTKSIGESAESLGKTFLPLIEKIILPALNKFANFLSTLSESSGIKNFVKNSVLWLIDLETQFKIKMAIIKNVLFKPFQLDTWTELFKNLGNTFNDFFIAVSKAIITGGKSITNFVKKLYEKEKNDTRTLSEEIAQIEKEGAEKKTKFLKGYNQKRIESNSQTSAKIIEISDAEQKAIEKKSDEKIKTILENEKTRLDKEKQLREVSKLDEIAGLDEILKRADLTVYERIQIVNKQNEIIASLNDESNKAYAEGEQKALEASKDRIKKHNKDLENLGKTFATDFQAGINSTADLIINGDNGIANKVTTALTNMFGGVGSFVGGFFGGAISQGIGDIITGIFGGRPAKTVADYARESFDKMVKNTNEVISNIGKEKTIIEKQVDILEELKNTLDENSEIPQNILQKLGDAQGTTIKKALENRLNQLKGITGEETAARQSQLIKMQQELQNKINERQNQVERIASEFNIRDYQDIIDLQDKILSGEYLNTEFKKFKDLDFKYGGNVFATTGGITAEIEGIKQAIEKFKLETLSPGNLDSILESMRLSKRLAELTGESPAYASGGVVSGKSYSGDKLIAKVNSGELILNKDQAANILYRLSNSPNQANNLQSINNQALLSKLDQLINISAANTQIELTAQGVGSLAKAIYNKNTDQLRKGEVNRRLLNGQ